MPAFTYVAKDVQGVYHRGDVGAVDERQAANLIRRKKLILISLKPLNEKQQKFWEKFTSRVSFTDVVVMTRQLATMIGAGLVLSEALDILQEQQSNKNFKKVLEDISTDINGGLDFASALEKHPEVFPSLYSKLIRAGQASGKMDTILLELAKNLEKQREFQGKVRSAMIYPAVVITMMGGVMGVMIFFVMPKLLSLYKESSMDLPLPTKILIGFSNFMLNFWWLVVIVVAGVVIAVKKYRATADGRLNIDKLILKTPILGRITTLVILTDFTRTLSLLIAAGLSILEAIKISTDVVSNQVFKDGLDISYKGVERGLTFSSQLLAMPTFPRIVGQMVKTGEETGKLDEVLSRVSEYFESEADNSLKNITTLIEPVILVLLGVGVAFLVISVILPIYQLTTNIQ
ncbi:MAG: type II secretion system F family protein [Patescibacteria group bacterium]|nr:type II secretion system F family protein [Patescibacteria group bacterium]